MTVRINASSDGLTETVDTSGILEFQTANTSALVIDISQNANFTSTGAIVVPVGTTATRPSAANGMIRYNSNSAAFEVYANNSWATANVTPAPTVVSAPVISGTAVVGNNLTCTTGTWNNNPTGYFYQWLANSVAISANATSNVFTLTSTQNNTNITCNVTAFNAAGNSIPSTSNSLGPVVTGYFLNRSLRFRSSASAFLNRTPASAGNRRTATFSFWIKRGNLSTDQAVFSLGAFPTNLFEIVWGSGNDFAVQNSPNSFTRDLFLISTQVFRDPSAWYHLVVRIDTTQATASNRARMYVNGSQITAFSTATYPAQNTDLNLGLTTANQINRRADGSLYQDAYLAEFYYIDGQSLDASSFGENNTNTGVWQPKAYTGTYGTNGFYLPFTNTTSTSTLGNDFSGNGNNWTVNNISLTAGATYDSMTDVPTLTDADTANYCVLNPLNNISTAGSRTIDNGNLRFFSTSSLQAVAYSSINLPTTGKFYYEVLIDSAGATSTTTNIYCGGANYYQNGTSNGSTAYGASWTTNDIIGVAVDIDTGSVTFYKNNSSQGARTGLSPANDFSFACNFDGSNRGCSINFGQRPFAYTPPSGFKALNTFNLPTPTIGATASTQANDYMNVVLYTGTGAAQTISGVGFQPDFTWIKSRSNSTNHGVFDVIRPSGFALYPNLTDAEANNSTLFTGFTSDGFGVAGTNITYNQNAATYVAWNWKAGTSNVTNTSGTITSTVSANTSAGFSIVTWTGTGSGTATVGHGLGVAPNLIITKPRNITADWIVYSSILGSNAYLVLNSSAAQVTGASTVWNNTAPTSTVFSLGSGYNYNATMLAYCFAEVAGYSKFGSYTGNGSSDGPFIFTGFRPRYLLIKRTDTTADWNIRDTARSPYNVVGEALYPNLAFAEYSGTETYLDILSNGFKLRGNWNSSNANGGSYIFMAFAESPFKYALAR